MRSILDTDLYKLTMGQAVNQLYPRAVAKYRFKNRNPEQPLTCDMIDAIHDDIMMMEDLSLTDDEAEWLREACPFLTPWYIDWLKGFRFNPEQVKIYPCEHFDAAPTFEIEIEGPWSETIYWEVPLLAIITEKIMAAQKPKLTADDESTIMDGARKKAEELRKHGCRFADFGTRRRFSYGVHEKVLISLVAHAGECFLGTSNVHLAMVNLVKPIGTMAHEFIQAISGLVGLRHANRFALDAWNRVYQGRLGIALTDTFGSRAFWRDFDGVYARLFDGVRQDSGDPIDFMKATVAHYKSLGIDPKSKSIIYSDSLNVGKAVLYQRASEPHIKCAFGIGTHLTNDVEGTVPANIVIKLVEIDGVPVVKLSDDPGKAIGDPKAIDVAKWTFGIGG